MTLTYTAVRRVAFLFLMLPPLIFFIGFLRPLVAVPASLLLCAAFFVIARERGERDARIALKPLHFVLLLLAALAWCWLGGIGNLYYQSADFAARNAVFRDLITFRWPVIYANKNSALVYYIGFWLPAALVGKCLLPFGEDVAFFGGNIALLLWATACTVTVFLLLALLLRAKTARLLFLGVLVFVAFSGLDLLGTLCNTAFMGHAFPDHLEWWAFYFQFSSHTTALFWVFNQALPCFVATLLSLSERRVRALGLILGCMLCFSPFACLGLFPFVAVKGVTLLREQAHAWRTALRELLTLPNLTALFALAPIFVLYYKTNLAFAMTKLPQLGGGHIAMATVAVLALVLALLGYRALARRARAPRPSLCFAVALALFLAAAPLLFSRAEPIYYSFLLVECGVYFILLSAWHHRDPLYYTAAAVLVLCPLFVIGTSADFSMRVSLPALCVLCVLCIRALLAFVEAWREGTLRTPCRVLGILLCVALLIGAATPITELVRGITAVAEEGTLLVINDPYGTMSGIFPNGIGSTDKNFIAWDYTKTFFFRYLAKGVG